MFDSSNPVGFQFLEKRFKKGFFKAYLNNYLLFLFEISDRLQLDPDEMTKEFLTLLYTDKTEIFY